jgi:hypothetical protein
VENKMAIIEHRMRDSPPCACCGQPTRVTTGVIDIGWDPAPLYFARWNPNAPAHGIALLIGLGDPRGFVAAKYSLEDNAITIIGPDDYDWQSDSIQVLERSDVVDTPLATKAFRVIDDIWTHDREIQAFTSNNDNANKP